MNSVKPRNIGGIKIIYLEQGMMDYAFNPRTWEEEADL